MKTAIDTEGNRTMFAGNISAIGEDYDGQPDIADI